jgi:hypothetical protein
MGKRRVGFLWNILQGSRNISVVLSGLTVEVMLHYCSFNRFLPTTFKKDLRRSKQNVHSTPIVFEDKEKEVKDEDSLTTSLHSNTTHGLRREGKHSSRTMHLKVVSIVDNNRDGHNRIFHREVKHYLRS